jgi:pimeloyl-ACP methyl ester carboxylesterase
MAQPLSLARRISPLLLLASIGCNDAVTPAAPAMATAGSALPAPQGALRDTEIDRTDTHFAYYVTSSESAGGEPLGSMSLAQDPAYETRYYETGYEADGDLRFNVYRQPSTDPDIPDPPALVRAVENMVYFYDQYGRLIAADWFASLMAAAGLPGGDLVNATTEGSIYYGGGGSGTPREPIYMESFPEGGKGPQTRRISDDLVEVVVVSPGGAQVMTAGAVARTETIRRYRKRTVTETDGTPGARTSQGHRWLLQEIEQTSWLPGRVDERQLRSVSRYSYVAHHINPGKDRQRRQRLEQRLASDASRGNTSPPLGEERSTRMASVDGINLCERHDINHVQTLEAGGAGIVWQHGFCDGAGTWRGMRPKIAESHYVGLSQAYSLNSDAYVRSQVADLASRLYAQPTRANVVVAHSQGGLVARRLGQGHPALVGAVITIGTPHHGARIASAGPSAVGEAISEAADDICFGNVMCPMLSEIMDQVFSGFLTWGVGELIPAAGDDRPGSAILDSINSTYEPFRRASIHVSVLKRWSIFRTLGDRDRNSPRERLLTESPLSGRNWAANAEMAYRAGWLLQDIARALRWQAYAYSGGWGCQQSGYYAHWEPCYNSYGYYHHWYLSSYWLSIASVLDWIGTRITRALNYIDRTWNDITAGSDRSDGFVQYGSQIYPNTAGASIPGHYPILGGEESHSGETASVAVMQKLRQALDQAQFPRN